MSANFREKGSRLWCPPVRPCYPSASDLGQFGSSDLTRQELRCCGLQAGLGWNLASIEFFQAVPPPYQLDLCEPRLRRANNDLAHRVENIEQGVECRPQLGRPMEPDQIAIRQLSDR